MAFFFCVLFNSLSGHKVGYRIWLSKCITAKSPNTKWRQLILEENFCFAWKKAKHLFRIFSNWTVIKITEIVMLQCKNLRYNVSKVWQIFGFFHKKTNFTDFFLDTEISFESIAILKWFETFTGCIVNCWAWPKVWHLCPRNWNNNLDFITTLLASKKFYFFN